MKKTSVAALALGGLLILSGHAMPPNAATRPRASTPS